MKEENIKKHIGNIVKKYRKSHNYTQQSLANLVGIGQRQITMIENGKSFPSFQTIIKISSILDLSLKNLFENQETEQHSIKEKVENIINKCADEELLQLYKILKVIKYKE